MSAATKALPRPERSGVARERRALPRRLGVRPFGPGRATLDDRITALWARLVETSTADCPVCGTEMSAGRACNGCGSELS